MVYTEVLDPLLRQDYYQGNANLDPSSKNLPTNGPGSSHQDTLRQLVKELKTPGLDPTRRDEILDQMKRLLKNNDENSVAVYIEKFYGFWVIVTI